jgi:glycosyltransferase involved in cell wall biosynthesis
MSAGIILCTYNGEKFIGKQIESYLAQTVLPDEIIVADDGSTDRTLEIIRNYASSNPDIQWRIVENDKTLGTNKNLEQALSYIDSDIIFFSDQDDLWVKDKIERTIFFFKEHPVIEASFSNAALIDDDNRQQKDTLLDFTFFKPDVRKPYKIEDLLYWSILMGNVMTGATMSVKRSSLSKILPFQLNPGRKLWYDGWIGFRMMATGQIGYIDENLISYRIHSGQQVGISTKEDFFEDYIMRGSYQNGFIKEYFQRYLAAISAMQGLKNVVEIPFEVEDRIKSEYQTHKRKYFASQPFYLRKLRLFKWYITRENYISFRDLITL